eukprot:1189689-Prorocentrum_minimum.AAC.3
MVSACDKAVQVRACVSDCFDVSQDIVPAHSPTTCLVCNARMKVITMLPDTPPPHLQHIPRRAPDGLRVFAQDHRLPQQEGLQSGELACELRPLPREYESRLAQPHHLLGNDRPLSPC